MSHLWGDDDDEEDDDDEVEVDNNVQNNIDDDNDDEVGNDDNDNNHNENDDVLGGDDEEDEDEEEDVLDMEGPITNTQVGALLMRFCPHDSSMLYPQENKRTRSLRYACRLCRYVEDAPNEPLVYRNERKKEIGNILHTVPSAVSDDPTLARSNQAFCTNCGHHQAVFFQSDVAQSDSLALIFVCCNCDHKWMN